MPSDAEGQDHLEPFTAELECWICGHEWQAFFPDGLAPEARIECPGCGFMNPQPEEWEDESDDDEGMDEEPEDIPSDLMDLDDKEQ